MGCHEYYGFTKIFLCVVDSLLNRMILMHAIYTLLRIPCLILLCIAREIRPSCTKCQSHSGRSFEFEGVLSGAYSGSALRLRFPYISKRNEITKGGFQPPFVMVACAFAFILRTHEGRSQASMFSASRSSLFRRLLAAACTRSVEETNCPLRIL